MQKKLSKYQCQIIPKKSWNKITQSFQIPLNNKKCTINVRHPSYNYVVQAMEYIHLHNTRYDSHISIQFDKIF